jgi:hypothetical protein
MCLVANTKSTSRFKESDIAFTLGQPEKTVAVISFAQISKFQSFNLQ